MTKHLLALLLFFAAGCATADRDESACSAKGGRVAGYSMLKETCERPATDAGQACSNNSECQGFCELADSAYLASPPLMGRFGVRVVGSRLRGIPAAGTPVAGECAALQTDIKVPNCRAYVADGKVAIAACAD